MAVCLGNIYTTGNVRMIDGSIRWRLIFDSIELAQFLANYLWRSDIVSVATDMHYLEFFAHANCGKIDAKATHFPRVAELISDVRHLSHRRYRSLCNRDENEKLHSILLVVQDHTANRNTDSEGSRDVSKAYRSKSLSFFTHMRSGVAKVSKIQPHMKLFSFKSNIWI